MKADKLPNMVATVRRGPGRPRKFEGGGIQMRFSAPADLARALEKYRDRRKFPDLTEAIRDLLREAAEERGLIEPRR